MVLDRNQISCSFDFENFPNPTMSFSSANTVYLQYLAKYPLLTKAITAGVLNGLNELIASILSRDFSSFKLSPNNKIVKMILYGSLILTPISHNLYGILSQVYGTKLTPILKICQVLTSVCTIQPIISAIFTAWISVINEFQPSAKIEDVEDLKHELIKLQHIVRRGLWNNYSRNLKSSVITNCVSLSIAQNFIKPELWVVFFNVVYFVLGTYQNTKIKMRMNKGDEDGLTAVTSRA